MSDAPPSAASPLVAEGRDAIAHVVRAVKGDPLAGPHRESWGSRLGWGAGLPIAILRALVQDPEARAIYGRTKRRQILAVLAIGTLLFSTAAAPREAQLHTRLFALVSSLYGALCVAEWMVIALSRQHDDRLAQLASERIAIPAEDDMPYPRVTLDLAWVWRKVKRRLRGVLVFSAALPLLLVAGAIPVAGPWVYAALSAAWGFYWLAVFLAAHTATGWTDQHTAADPFFVAALARTADRLPKVLAWMPRLYYLAARKMTRAMAAPCGATERSPFELAGLALTRALFGLPVLYLLVRPFFSVAAARINLRTPPPKDAIPTLGPFAEVRSEPAGVASSVD